MNLASIGVIAAIAAAAPPTIAQTAADSRYEAKRQKAAELLEHDKRLEALPLLEELVKTNPTDDAMLVALAAALVDHAATLTNDEAAGKERLRARDLLNKALDLGNTSPLAMNLAQLLGQLPSSGAITFSKNPRVERFMRAGEAAFSRRAFDDALENYSKALELEPRNYSAVLFTANTYDKQNNLARAAQWYQRAIELDPNVETAYRYYATLLAKEGDMGKARAMLIQAAVAEPYNRIVWRELHTWATLNNTRINLVYIGVPAASMSAYEAVRAKWQQGGEFQKRFPEEKEYRHTLAEESEALIAAADVLVRLESNDAAVMLLLKLYRAGLIEPYVLFSLGDPGIARDYAVYRTNNRKKLEEYMDKFVVPTVSDSPE